MAGAILYPVVGDLKRCTKCLLEKSTSEFNVYKKNGLPQSQCRDCRKAACRTWYAENIDSERERARNRMRIYGPKERKRNKLWALANPDKARHNSRKKLLGKKYNMTIEEHEALFASQGFSCGACGSPSPNSKKGWSTDHCHKTGVVRGILCHHCNVGIGHAKDSIETLRRWVSYLAKAQALPSGG